MLKKLMIRQENILMVWLELAISHNSQERTLLVLAILRPRQEQLLTPRDWGQLLKPLTLLWATKGEVFLAVEQILVRVFPLQGDVAVADHLHVLEESALLVDSHHVDVVLALVLLGEEVALVCLGYLVDQLVDLSYFVDWTHGVLLSEIVRVCRVLLQWPVTLIVLEPKEPVMGFQFRFRRQICRVERVFGILGLQDCDRSFVKNGFRPAVFAEVRRHIHDTLVKVKIQLQINRGRQLFVRALNVDASQVLRWVEYVDVTAVSSFLLGSILDLERSYRVDLTRVDDAARDGFFYREGKLHDLVVSVVVFFREVYVVVRADLHLHFEHFAPVWIHALHSAVFGVGVDADDLIQHLQDDDQLNTFGLLLLQQAGMHDLWCGQLSTDILVCRVVI